MDSVIFFVSGTWISDSISLVGFQTPYVAFQIPNPGIRIPQQKFARFLILQAKFRNPGNLICRIPDSLSRSDKTTGIYKTRIVIVHVCILWNCFSFKNAM